MMQSRDVHHELSTEDATLLYELQRLWHDRYVIGVTDGQWHAKRICGGVQMTSDSGRKLRHRITQDAIQWNHESYARNR
jgi:hypothetical protein